MVDFPLSYHPLLPPQTLWMGSIGQNSTFFQNSTNTNQQRHLYWDNMRRSRNFLSGGGGVQAPQLILQFTEGVQWFYYTFSRGGGLTISRGVQMLISIETHITITCVFQGGPDPPSPSGSANVQCGILARIGSNELVRPPFKLLIGQKFLSN